MRGARRLTIACLAAGLMLGSASASAQDAAATTNTPAAQSVGPRELQNFSLQGNVTRPTEEPAQRTATPVAANPDDQPTASAPAERRAARRETATSAPTPRATRTTEPARRDPVPETVTATSQPTARADTGLLTQPTATPASAPTFPPPPVSPGTPSSGFSLLPWLLAALALAGGAFLLFWRNRSRPSLAGGPQVDSFQAPEAKPVRWLTPEPEPRPVPSPAPAPAPAAAPRVETPAPKPAGRPKRGRATRPIRRSSMH